MNPEKHPGHDLGIDLDKLLKDAKKYLIKLEQFDQASYEFYDLDISIIDMELAKKLRTVEQPWRKR